MPVWIQVWTTFFCSTCDCAVIAGIFFDIITNFNVDLNISVRLPFTALFAPWCTNLLPLTWHLINFAWNVPSRLEEGQKNVPPCSDRAKIRSLSHKCGWPLSCNLETNCPRWKSELRPVATNWSSVWPVRGPCRGFLLGDSEWRLHPWNEALCCSDKGEAKHWKTLLNQDIPFHSCFSPFLEITGNLDQRVGGASFSHTRGWLEYCI